MIEALLKLSTRGTVLASRYCMEDRSLLPTGTLDVSMTECL
jgi:hypothetical protein